MFPKVKVDYSTKSKELENDITIPGCYAVYTRKSIFHKWTQQTTYADLYMAIRDAMQVAKYTLPKYFKNE
jgi:hypothetical protein